MGMSAKRTRGRCRHDRPRPETTCRGYRQSVPGTVAGTLRDLGQWTWGDDDEGLLDGSDWWYRCRFDAPEGSVDGPWQLELDGLATVADVWLNGEHLVHSENMWVAHRLPVDRLAAPQRAAASLRRAGPAAGPTPAPPPLAKPAPPLAEPALVPHDAAGPRRRDGRRAGRPVGPWRPVRLRRGGSAPFVAGRSVRATCDGADGVVEIHLRLEGVEAGTEVELRVGEHRHATTAVEPDGATVVERHGPRPRCGALVAAHARPSAAVRGGPDCRRRRPRPWQRRFPDGGGRPRRRGVHALAQRRPHLLPRRALGSPRRRDTAAPPRRHCARRSSSWSTPA